MKKAVRFIYHSAIMVSLMYSAGYMLHSGNYVIGGAIAIVAIVNIPVFLGLKKVKHFLD